MRITQLTTAEYSLQSSCSPTYVKECARNNLSILYPLTPTLSRRERELVVEVISCAFLNSLVRLRLTYVALPRKLIKVSNKIDKKIFVLLKHWTSVLKSFLVASWESYLTGRGVLGTTLSSVFKISSIFSTNCPKY